MISHGVSVNLKDKNMALKQIPIFPKQKLLNF